MHSACILSLTTHAAVQQLNVPSLSRNMDMSKEQAEQTWAKLEAALEKIHQHDASMLSFEELYRYAYNMVLHRCGARDACRLRSVRADAVCQCRGAHVLCTVVLAHRLPVPHSAARRRSKFVMSCSALNLTWCTNRLSARYVQVTPP